MATPLDHLASVLSPGAVSTADADRLAVSADLWPRHLLRMAQGECTELPLAVAWPESTEEVKRLVSVAGGLGLTLVPYGAGSSVVGGATPTQQQVVVDLKRMARVVEVDTQKRSATAQTGIIGELFERQLQRRGFTQGHFPSSIYCSSLGGWIAARSAGQMSSRYGKIEDQILGGTIVLGDGSVLRQEPSLLADPLFASMVGAEGTLGIWTEATVRIHPLPQERAWRGFTFPNLEQALHTARAWLEAGLTINLLRIYDPLDTLLHRQAHGEQIARDRGPSKLAWLGAQIPRLTGWLGDRLAGGCRCVVGIQGDAERVVRELSVLIEIAQQHEARDLGPGPGQAWYARRYAVSYEQSRAFRAGVLADTMEVACAWDRLVPTYERVRDRALRCGAQVLAHFSHLYLEGGSIYFTYAMPISLGTEGYDRLWKETLRTAQQTGANVSHHHGTGRLKAKALREAMGGARQLFEQLQERTDPAKVLNPILLEQTSTFPASRDRRVKWRATAAPGLLRARPQLLMGDLERRLQSQGRTLGPVAGLFERMPLVEAARKRWLWQVNPQLRALESLVLGVDGKVDGRAHWCVPAPRAAMGPDITGYLLEQQVEAIRLRSCPTPSRQVCLVGAWQEVVAASTRLVGDEECAATKPMIAGGPENAQLFLQLPAARLGDFVLGRALEHAHLLDRVSMPVRPMPHLPDGAFFFGGTWSGIVPMLHEAAKRDLRFVLPWIEPAGAVGFLYAPDGNLNAKVTAHLRQLSKKLSLPPSLQRSKSETQSSEVTDVTPSCDFAPMDSRPALELASWKANLENCTFCPKLCRFACPVAVADGTETLTPRQLVLTANLHVRGVRALTSDVASRLWACMDCRGCETFCDHGNQVALLLEDARAELWARGAVPSQIRETLEAVQRAGLDASNAWHAGPGKLGIIDDASSRTCFFPGCQNSPDDPQPVIAGMALAKARFKSVRQYSGSLACCGHPLWRWGDRRGFAEHARQFADQLGDAARIVVDDPGCAFALRELYPRVGIRVPPVVTTFELLRDVSWQVRDPQPWALHDDAFSLRWLKTARMGDLPALKALALPTGSILEGESGCCGGMLLDRYDPALAQRVARYAIEDLLGGDAQRILTASPTCRRRLRGAGAPVDDLLSLWHLSTLED